MTPTPRIGTEFAGYRIHGLLGYGGMGVVYRAEHPRTGATIALKLMDPELAMDEAFRERFVREARSAARIRHPNIVPVYDAGEWEGDLFIAMGYIDGADLKTLLRKKGRLTTDESYEIGRQIASGLDTAHQRGLIHRDVKPANILLEPGPDPDSGPLAYLADLGLTKHVDSHGGATESGALLGTIDYIPPEQISGERVDGRADVYSLACVLFECLTGNVPYVRDTQAAALWAHLHDEIPSARNAEPSLPAEVDEALARGMAKSPDDRFATARELVAALRGPVDRLTIGPNGAEARRKRGPPPEASAPTAPAERRRRRRGLALATVVGAVAGALAATGAALLLRDDEIDSPRTTPGTSSTVETPPPTVAALTPFDRELLRYVPDGLRTGCRHVRPLTPDFDASVSCRPGGIVSSLRYSHARSGILLYDYFATGMERAGLPAMPTYRHPAPIGLCSNGDLPSINLIVTVGLSRRIETSAASVTREERVGFIRCYRHGGRARIEWTTSELGIYAVATAESKSLAALYDWWSKEAGPEP